MKRRSLPVVSCDGCGACCMHIGTPPAMFPLFANLGEKDPETCRRMGGDDDFDIWEAMPESLRQELADYYRAVLIDKNIPSRSGKGMPCLWFDEETRRCRHYEHRPSTCRDFEVGGVDCLGHRKRVGISP